MKLTDLPKLVRAQGKLELIRHLRGEALTPKQAGLARCYDCMGYYVDGKKSCKTPSCPLYPRMPYRDNG